MGSTTDPLSLLLAALKEQPRGMSVSDLATAVGITGTPSPATSTSLLVAGQVEMKTYSKVSFYPRNGFP